MTRSNSPLTWLIAFLVFDVVVVVAVLALTRYELGFFLPMKSIATLGALALVGLLVRVQRR